MKGLAASEAAGVEAVCFAGASDHIDGRWSTAPLLPTLVFFWA